MAESQTSAMQELGSPAPESLACAYASLMSVARWVQRLMVCCEHRGVGSLM